MILRNNVSFGSGLTDISAFPFIAILFYYRRIEEVTALTDVKLRDEIMLLSK